jgi:hypothetical protein
VNFEGVEREKKDVRGFAGRGAVGKCEEFAVRVERVYLG